MRQELTVEIGAPRDDVWAALAGDLVHRGDHVDVVGQEPPVSLQIVVRSAPGEQYTLWYRLDALDARHTAIVAAIEPVGWRYTLKRLFSFGTVDRGYLDAIAVGLANLRARLEPEAASGQDDPLRC